MIIDVAFSLFSLITSRSHLLWYNVNRFQQFPLHFAFTDVIAYGEVVTGTRGNSE